MCCATLGYKACEEVLLQVATLGLVGLERVVEVGTEMQEMAEAEGV